MRADIQRLLQPSSVAIVGPLDRRGDPEAALRPIRTRFGEVFDLVDPTVDGGGGPFGGRPVLGSVAELPEAVDVAVLDVGPDRAVALADACGRRGVRALVVTTPAFGELGEAGAAAERELLATVRRHGMRMLGPGASLNAFEAMPAPVTERGGRIALITQSGHMGRVIFQSSPHGVAFSRWVPTGGEADLEAADFIEYFAEDMDTAVIACYIEGFRDGDRLRVALAAARAHGKPVVLIKVGRHQAAARMAVAHSAHLTGSDAVVDGLFRQYGVLRVDDVDELVETAALYAKLAPWPAGAGVGLYGYAGGAVALMADVAESSGVRVPVLADATQARLHEVLPPYLGVSNPVDSGNLYRGGGEDERRRVFDVLADDESVAMLVCASSGVIPGLTEDFAGDILHFQARGAKPVVVAWCTWEMDTPAYGMLVRSGVPLFRSFRNCFRALRGLFERERRASVIDAARPLPAAGPGGLLDGPASVLGPGEAAALLRRAGVPLVAEAIVASAGEVREAAAAVGLPAVAKASLAGFEHRSDAGLVLTGLRSAEDVAAAYDALVARAAELAPGAPPPPVLVQRQVEPGVEMIVGVTRDATLGPAVLVGMGGVLTEVVRDVSVRPLPVAPEDVDEMIAELRGAAALDGVRGAPAADTAALRDVVLAVARLAGDPDARIVALDLNPVIVGPGGATAVDWLVEVAAAPAPGGPSQP